MKIFTALLSLSLLISAYAIDEMKTTSTKGSKTYSAPNIKTTHQDIQKTLGTVPSFFKMYPDTGLPAAWEEFKSVQLDPNTALPSKLKQLISLGIASQIPSNECVYMNRQFAMLNGATEAEMKETVAMAGATRHWSTILNGFQEDESKFRRETQLIITHAKDEMKKAQTTTGVSPQVAKEPIDVFDSTTAYLDIKQTLGSIPSFIRKVPEDSVAGAWKMMKSIQLNPNTTLTAKEKELIGLAIAAQIPCSYCVYFHTEAAILNNATDNEIREAVTVASVTRLWSTILHGSVIDERKFRSEIDQIIKHLKTKNGKTVGLK